MDKDPRPSMKGAPCGRRVYKKCAGEEWDGKKGCPFWQSMLVTIQDGKNKYEVVRGQCVDLWMYDLGWFAQNRLSGIQQAGEGTRNMVAMQSLVMSRAAPREKLVEIGLRHHQPLLEGNNDNL